MAGRAGRLTIAFGVALAGAAQAAPSGADLLADEQASGAAAVMKAHFAPDGGDGYPALEAGSPEAIRVAADILSGPSDAGYTLGLRDALAKALQVHPERVLPIVGSHPALAADAVCVPFLSADEKSDVLEASLARTRAALASEPARAYPRQAAACRTVLARAERSLRRHPSPR